MDFNEFQVLNALNFNKGKPWKQVKTRCLFAFLSQWPKSFHLFRKFTQKQHDCRGKSCKDNAPHVKIGNTEKEKSNLEKKDALDSGRRNFFLKNHFNKSVFGQQKDANERKGNVINQQCLIKVKKIATVSMDGAMHAHCTSRKHPTTHAWVVETKTGVYTKRRHTLNENELMALNFWSLVKTANYPRESSNCPNFQNIKLLPKVFNKTSQYICLFRSFAKTNLGWLLLCRPSFKTKSTIGEAHI